MRIKPIFAWYDIWIGLFIDRSMRRLYIFPVPCFGLMIEFGLKETEIDVAFQYGDVRLWIPKTVNYVEMRPKFEELKSMDEIRKNLAKQDIIPKEK